MDTSEKTTGKVIQINERAVKNHLNEIVRGTVEETLNEMLDAEADALCNAERYERTDQRKDTRAGHYKRKLDTQAGRVELKVPKLRKLPFESAIIKRYQRRETSVEEALIEMYLAGVSVRRVEDITQANIDGADLRDVTGWTTANFTGVTGTPDRCPPELASRLEQERKS